MKCVACHGTGRREVVEVVERLVGGGGLADRVLAQERELVHVPEGLDEVRVPGKFGKILLATDGPRPLGN